MVKSYHLIQIKNTGTLVSTAKATTYCMQAGDSKINSFFDPHGRNKRDGLADEE
jgi:hypothetical protein